MRNGRQAGEGAGVRLGELLLQSGVMVDCGARNAGQANWLRLKAVELAGRVNKFAQALYNSVRSR